MPIELFPQILKFMMKIFVAITQSTGALIELFLQNFRILVEIFIAMRQSTGVVIDCSHPRFSISGGYFRSAKTI